MKIALAQINTTIGDFEGNFKKILDAYKLGAEKGVDLVLTPELALTGYPPRDLLLRKDFVDKNLAILEDLAAATEKTGLIVGYVGKNVAKPGRDLTNSAALLQNGKIVATRTKILLPTYDVFDEDRYFEPAAENTPIVFNGKKIGVTICEDIWNDEDFWRERRYRRNPPAELFDAGAELLINISASPWHLGKDKTRRAMLSNLASKFNKPVVYCNLVGGNDELVFDGGSLVFNRRGEPIACGSIFKEDFIIADIDVEEPVIKPPEMVDEEYIFRALVIGLQDYMRKCGFKSAVLGLSGGIDSALTACIAAAALGSENVLGVSLPSQYSSKGSLDDARKLAENLKIRYEVIPIQEPFESLKKQLAGLFAGLPEDITEENIQARIRGVILMALSNKFGSLLLTTGNKSEMGVGYCTLYGDMCGGLAVISDVPKTMVYRIARWINRAREVIPQSSIIKPPSAELRPNQTDQDTLPPYEILDAILEAYVVEGKSPQEIVNQGFEAATVKYVIKMIENCEYKRRQAAPGIKVTTRAFGMGWRVPLAKRVKI
ncbi:MAG: NAD+ synthase [Verrucomicrobiia bacterium]